MSLTELLRINSWAKPWQSSFESANLGEVQALSLPRAIAKPEGLLADFARARRQYHFQLIALGTARWNDWAAQMSALNRGLRNSRIDAIWAAFAHVDFSDETFQYELDVATLSFPGAFSLTRSRMDTYFTASGMQVFGAFNAANANFAHDATLQHCVFHGPVHAYDSQWRGRIEARNMTCYDELRLRGCNFSKDIWFSDSKLSELADFTGAHFASDAGFGGAHFGGVACFDGVEFDDTLGMEACHFSSTLTFRRAKFSKRLFLRDAVFAEEPVIDGAHFASAPVLDGAQFPDAAPLVAARSSIRRVAADG